MDPDRTLEQIRNIIDQWDGDQGDELCSLVSSLDQWLSREGFLPGAWKGNR